MSNVDELRARLHEPGCVVFVGAGVSAWSGLPTWRDLLGRLADYRDGLGLGGDAVRAAVGDGNLPFAASLGMRCLDAGQRREFLEFACATATARPSEAHRLLAALPPDCFVTTNYDQLLETALRTYRSETYAVILNDKPVEVAELYEPRASRFVFKPHGDIGRCETVVLTREDYRELRRRHPHVLEALKQLLAGRPVVFFGFDLSDPDFLLTMDTLLNLFGQPIREHCAVLPAAPGDVVAYWRETYGISVVTYPVTASADPAVRHAGFLDLLRAAAAAPRGPGPAAAPDAPDAAVVLGLLRHAKGLLNRSDLARRRLLPIRAWARYGGVRDRLSGERVDRAIVRNRVHILLLGPPGSGKSVAARAAARTLAKRLERDCLRDPLPKRLQVPVLLDLRGYDGDLRAMAARALPKAVDLDDLVARGWVTFLLDGLNEVPDEWLESRAFADDVRRFRSYARRCPVTLTSRYAAGLAQGEIPTYDIKELDRSYVVDWLRAYAPALARNKEITALLQRPFFFHLAAGGQVPLRDGMRPHDIVLEAFADQDTAFAVRFGVDLLAFLGPVAVEMLAAGSHSCSADRAVAAATATGLRAEPATAVDWLVERGVLVALPRRRVAFAHQLFAEFLAARRMASGPDTGLDPVTLLTHRGWDQVVLFWLGLLAADQAPPVLDRIVDVDPALALRSLSYVGDEQNRRAVLAGIRDRAPRQPRRLAWPVYAAFGDVEPTPDLVPLLWQIADRGGWLGGGALGYLLEHVVERVDTELVDFLFAHGEDRALVDRSGFYDLAIDDHVAGYLWRRAGEVELTPDDLAALQDGGSWRLGGLAMTLSTLLDALDPGWLADRLRTGAVTRFQAEIAGLCHVVAEDPVAVELTVELLRRGGDVTRTLYHQLHNCFSPTDFPGELYDTGTAEVLLDRALGHTDPWALAALQVLAAESEVWRLAVTGAAPSRQGVLRDVLAYAAGAPRRLRNRLTAVARDEARFPPEVARLCAYLAIDWTGREDLFLALLLRRDLDLTRMLVSRVAIDALDIALPVRDAAVVDWLADVAEQDTGLASLLGVLLANADGTGRALLVDVFNQGDDRRRSALARWVLERVGWRHLAALSDDAVTWLLDTAGDRADVDDAFLVAHAVDEAVVRIRLLPRYAETVDPHRRGALQAVLIELGQRHGRRYVGADGTVLT